MRIAYIYTALLTIGGVDRILSTKANYLADKLGYEVFIITDSQRGAPPVFPLSDKIKHIDLEVNFDKQYHEPNILKRYLSYRNLMRLYKNRLTSLLKDLHCDIVCSTCGRELDFLTEINDGSAKIGESHIARKYMRNFHLMEQKGFLFNWAAKYWRHKQEQAIKSLDTFVVLTKRDSDSWLPVRDSLIIPNPNTLEPHTTLHPNSHSIISVGRLDAQKGYDLLVEAWAKIANEHPEWSIKIFGNGPEKHKLLSRIKQLGIENSFFICNPTQEIEKFYCQSAFYVMSSRFEGFGLVLAEAMSCGIPCISFDCPHGPAEIIKDGEDGILVPREDIKALSQAIQKLIIDKGLREKLGAKAKNNIKRYSQPIIMEQWNNLFIKTRNNTTARK